MVGFDDRSGDIRVVGWTDTRAGVRRWSTTTTTMAHATGRTSHCARHGTKGDLEGEL